MVNTMLPLNLWMKVNITRVGLQIMYYNIFKIEFANVVLGSNIFIITKYAKINKKYILQSNNIKKICFHKGILKLFYFSI